MTIFQFQIVFSLYSTSLWDRISAASLVKQVYSAVGNSETATCWQPAHCSSPPLMSQKSGPLALSVELSRFGKRQLEPLPLVFGSVGVVSSFFIVLQSEVSCIVKPIKDHLIGWYCGLRFPLCVISSCIRTRQVSEGIRY